MTTTTWTIEISACDDEIRYEDVTYTHWIRVFDASGRSIAGHGFTTRHEAKAHASGIFLGIALAGHHAGIVDKTESEDEGDEGDESETGECGSHASDREDFHADG